MSSGKNPQKGEFNMTLSNFINSCDNNYMLFSIVNYCEEWTINEIRNARFYSDINRRIVKSWQITEYEMNLIVYIKLNDSENV